jgi:L-ribulose-5-phosphate 4-epimerase
LQIKELKKRVCEANLALVKHRLVISTFGNVSGIDRKLGMVAIKPSGVPYNDLTPEKIVVVDLNGKVVDGDLKPSMDTMTHLMLYLSWSEIGGVCHTHSPFATAFAQAEKPIPCLGTTHADHFYGEIPVTRQLRMMEVRTDYEKNTGRVILETFKKIKPMEMPGVLVAKHGPFTWGKDEMDAVNNSLLLEEIAKMTFMTFQLNPKIRPVAKYILDQHYLRKHGPKAIYGQNKK